MEQGFGRRARSIEAYPSMFSRRESNSSTIMNGLSPRAVRLSERH
jgi:hypothetical protein